MKLSTAFTVMGNTPTSEGVPANTPSAVSDIPAGKLPEVTDHVRLGAVASETVKMLVGLTSCPLTKSAAGGGSTFNIAGPTKIEK